MVMKQQKQVRLPKLGENLAPTNQSSKVIQDLQDTIAKLANTVKELKERLGGG